MDFGVHRHGCYHRQRKRSDGLFGGLSVDIGEGVVASNSIGSATVSQANTYGNPTNAVFALTRTGSTASALQIFFSFGGTAPAGSYTASANNSVTFAAGQDSTNVTITAVNGNVARPTTTIVLTLSSSSVYYSVPIPGTATLALINTAPDVLVASTQIPTMYNAFSNDYAAFIMTRWGDTNAATFTASSFSYSGTAVAGTDYTYPTAVTFNPGDLTQTNFIYPLSNGQLPVDSASNSLRWRQDSHYQRSAVVRAMVVRPTRL